MNCLLVKHCSMGRWGLFVLDGGSRKSKERSQLMIIDITTGFFRCTGHKPGCPWPSMTAQQESVLTCPLYGPVKGTLGQLALLLAREQTVAGVWPLTESPYSPSHQGILCDYTCSMYAQMLKHQKCHPSLKLVCLCVHSLHTIC